ncbi:MAG TPA: lipid II flippase MurJ, partial [Myxococcota bacterium]|nr:lipid II flippase MurJ [Myxococcota bacterium]
SISSINYATTLLNLGLQAFNLSLVVVMFTKLSQLYSAGDLDGYNGYFQDNLRKVCNIVVPASLGVFLANDEIVRALFERGSFDAADTARTAGALGMYMLGLPALIINGIVTKIFHSLQRLKEKIWLAVQYIVTNIIGNMLLVGSLKVTGLAISSTVAINLHLLLSLWVLYTFRSGVVVRPLLATLTRSYTIALITWFLMSGGHIGRGIAEMVPFPGLVGTFVIAALKFGATAAIYVALAMGWRRLRGLLRRAGQ